MGFKKCHLQPSKTWKAGHNLQYFLFTTSGLNYKHSVNDQPYIVSAKSKLEDFTSSFNQKPQIKKKSWENFGVQHDMEETKEYGKYIDYRTFISAVRWFSNTKPHRHTHTHIYLQRNFEKICCCNMLQLWLSGRHMQRVMVPLPQVPDGAWKLLSKQACPIIKVIRLFLIFHSEYFLTFLNQILFKKIFLLWNDRNCI